MVIFLTLLADIFQLILTNFMENKALYLILYQVHFDLAMFQYFTKINKYMIYYLQSVLKFLMLCLEFY